MWQSSLTFVNVSNVSLCPYFPVNSYWKCSTFNYWAQLQLCPQILAANVQNNTDLFLQKLKKIVKKKPGHCKDVWGLTEFAGEQTECHLTQAPQHSDLTHRVSDWDLTEAPVRLGSDVVSAPERAFGIWWLAGQTSSNFNGKKKTSKFPHFVIPLSISENKCRNAPFSFIFHHNINFYSHCNDMHRQMWGP